MGTLGKDVSFRGRTDGWKEWDGLGRTYLEPLCRRLLSRVVGVVEWNAKQQAGLLALA